MEIFKDMIYWNFIAIYLSLHKLILKKIVVFPDINQLIMAILSE